MRPAVALLVALVAVAGARSPARADVTGSCIAPSERGQVLLDQHKLIEARTQFVACAAPQCPAALQKECTRWLDEVRARMPTISISARDDQGHDVVDVRVFVDGKPFASRLDGTAVPIDPGEHLFRYEPRGAAPVEERVLVREGEANRLLTVRLPSEPTPPPSQPREPARPIPTGAFVLGGVSLVGAGVFAFFAATAKGNLGDLRDTCGRTQSCPQSDVDGVRRDLVIANVALGVGALALAGAVWMLLDRPAASAPPAARGASR